MAASGKTAPYAFAGLDRIIHEKARLGILTSLVGHRDGLPFIQLRQLCGLTDGNLSRHLQVLEDAGIVALNKGYDGKRPLTRCVVTDHGRAAFTAYLAELEAVVRSAAKAARTLEADRLKPSTT
jgi:DNA-binding transcriptional ArsR family regulator